ncbi:hypothetical protein [Caulobacter endophyticus]|uniref:hypothetical protein n=1 Tax=Caulobacter endophyticus TaxID=2172652 RepID=UPI00240FA603|nr:hypothetical protein [Caulobacter endophyticus]MDG2529200.1 hypothetical protein [Caulobacter endophyticus]
MTLFRLPSPRAVAATGVAAALAVGAAQAAAPVAPALKALLDCRAIAENDKRLACYDAAVDSITTAEKKGEVIIVDRQQAQAARRQAFGLDLSALSIFDRGEKSDELDRITGQVTKAVRGADGRWLLTLADGATWRQSDDRDLPSPPKPGSKVEIRKAAAGSYLMNIDGQIAIRARRVIAP